MTEPTREPMIGHGYASERLVGPDDLPDLPGKPQVAPTNSQTWEQPSRDDLLAEGANQARIHGVDPEQARVYAQGWADAMGRADRALDEMDREMLKVTRTAQLNADAMAAARIAELERQIRCVQIYGYGYLLRHGGEQIALDPKDVTVVLPSTWHMDDFDLHNSLYLAEQQFKVLEERIRNVRERCAETSSSYRDTAWELAQELLAVLDGESEEKQ